MVPQRPGRALTDLNGRGCTWEDEYLSTSNDLWASPSARQRRHLAEAPSRWSPKCLQTLDALVFGTTLFFWIGGIVSVEEINMNWYNSILSQHYLNNKTFTFYLCPLIMNYRVPKKLLLLVVVFKLDHHISGAMSNATQICWSKYVGYFKLFWSKNWRVPRKK